MDDRQIRSPCSKNQTSENSLSYYIQALGLSLGVAFLAQRQGRLSGIQAFMIATWFIGVSAIFWRYGAIGQWSFYQNDQYFHWKIVAHGYGDGFNLSFDRLNFFRVPFTAPAFLLSQVGFDPTVALKFVSLCCALGNVSLVERYLRDHNAQFTLFTFWLVAGPIASFFSLLALRETMMLLCVTQLFIGVSQSGKALSLLILLILRPHLAAAILFGQVWGWIFSRLKRNWYLPSVLLTALLPIYLGTLGFSLGNYVIYRLPLQLYQDLFLKAQVIQVFSAFAGLQFFTVAYQTVEFTTRSLILVRLIFPEIVLVPLLFTGSCFLFTPRTTRLKLSVLATFVFFTAVSSGTEYLSVRQSLPIMSVMGVAVLLSFSREIGSLQSTLKDNRVSSVSAQRVE